MWKIFARPIRIQDEQGDCVVYLDELSNKFQVDLRKMQSELNTEIMAI